MIPPTIDALEVSIRQQQFAVWILTTRVVVSDRFSNKNKDL
jgi:hypothetical protein